MIYGEDQHCGTRTALGARPRKSGWRCTDVGRRTILAIELNPDLEEAWLAGPPYVVREVVFDEIEMERAFRSTDEAISQSLEALEDETQPSIPAEAARLMLRAELETASRKYPRQRLLLINRVDTAGEILHPYAANNQRVGHLCQMIWTAAPKELDSGAREMGSWL